jgi:DNA-binding IclR family transcriptional regulator
VERYKILNARVKAYKLQFDDGYTMHSFERALPEMDCIITAEGREISLTDLSREPTLPKDSVHSVLATLARNKYLQQQKPHTGKYDSGLRFLDIECDLNGRETLGKAITPLLKQLYSESIETSAQPFNGKRD